MTLELFALAALLFSDPSGDAHGAGELVPPSAPVYASRAPFDLVEVRIEDAAELRIDVRLAGIPDPGALPNGLTLPVLDLYLDTADGGREELLPGPGMRMPAGRGWELALRVHGDDAYLVRAETLDGAVQPVDVRVRGDRLSLSTGVPRPETVRSIQAVTGVYDPFARNGWRPLAASPSPWAFASERPAPPVIDLLAEDDAAQREALRSFVLPARRARFGALPWLALMATGLAVALAGLLLRRRVPPERRPDAPAPVAATRHRTPTPDGAGRGAASPPSERTLPTRLAARDGWWGEGVAAESAASDASDASDAAVGAAASETRTWPAPTDRSPPIWAPASGPAGEDAASSEGAVTRVAVPPNEPPAEDDVPREGGPDERDAAPEPELIGEGDATYGPDATGTADDADPAPAQDRDGDDEAQGEERAGPSDREPSEEELPERHRP